MQRCGFNLLRCIPSMGIVIHLIFIGSIAIPCRDATAEEMPPATLVTSGSTGSSETSIQSPDGHFFAMPAGNGVDVWDIESGYKIRSFKGPKSTVAALAFSGDGKQLAAAAGAVKSAEVFVWDFESGRVNATYQLSAPAQFSIATYVTITGLMFSEDMRQLLCAGSFGATYGKHVEKEIVRVIELSSGQVTQVFKNPGAYDVSTLAASPTKSIVALGMSDGTIKVNKFGGPTLKTIRTAGDTVSFVTFSPDGQRLASASYSIKRERTKIEVWDLNRGTKQISLSEDETFTGVTWGPDGKTLATRSANTLRIWDADNGNLLNESYSLGVGGQLVSYLHGENALLTVTSAGLAKINIKDLKIIHQYGFSLATNIVLGSTPNTTEVLIEPTGAPCFLYAVNVLTGNITRKAGIPSSYGSCPSLVSSLDGTKLSGILFGDTLKNDLKRGVTFLDLSDNVTPRTLASNLTNADSVSMSADGQRLAVQDANSIIVIDTSSGSVLRKLNAPKKNVGIFAISPDGNRVASSDSIGIYPQGGSLYVWDLVSGGESKFLQKEQFSDKKLPSSRLVFAPDGQSFAGTESNSNHYSLDYWSTQGPKLIRQINLPDNSTIMQGAAFHPDGDKLLVGSWDGIIRLWNINTGSLIRNFIGHTAPINQVRFAAKSQRIVSSDNDTVRIWDTITGKLLLSIYVTADGEWLEVTPEGFFDASTKGANMLNVVRGLEAYSIDQFFDALHRPDLVREKLAGDPAQKVRDAADKLDLGKAIASGRPPNVIISRTNAETTSSPTIVVSASITDQGGGLGKTEWRVNGITIGIEQIQAPAGQTVTLRKDIPLEAGDNRIEVVAYNAQGIVSSNPGVITVKLDETATTTPPRLYVVAVGINEYWDSRLKLTFASPDATSFAKAMEEGGKGLYQKSEIILLTDEKATAASLDETFSSLSSKVHSQDVFVLFMAGHGKTVDGRFYFIPQEFHYRGDESVARDGIGQDQLQKWLGRIPARKSILLFDSCESGTLTGDKVASRGMEEMTAIDRLTHAMGRSVLTATTDDKPAFEGVGGHGVFTYALLQALREAPSDSDGLIDVMELASYVDRRVPEISYEAFQMRQVPQAKIVGSNFPLSHRLSPEATDNGKLEKISRDPSHVVIRSANAFESASTSAKVTIVLTPGTQVRMLTTSNGWVLIARDGSKVGFVQESALAALH
jgi:WD40 repeat protein/uncharacterized caspase-like protein